MTSNLNSHKPPPGQYISEKLSGMDLAYFMQAALDEAEAAGEAGELPIGAVVVLDGEVIARGRARHKERMSQLSHAELNALLSGGERLWHDYCRAVLLTTVEPCPMCLGAAVMADVPHVVFAIHDQVVHSAETVACNPYVRRHIQSYYGGVLVDQAKAVFERYDPKTLAYILGEQAG